jgi:hypothetical protein
VKVKNKGGAPHKKISKNNFEALCAIQCSTEEICAVLGVCRQTLYTWVKDQYDEESYLTVYSEKSSVGKVSIRRKQYDVAMKGDRNMLKHLGVNWLGQVERSHKDVVEKIVYTNEATEKSDEEIAERLEELRKKKELRDNTDKTEIIDESEK